MKHVVEELRNLADFVVKKHVDLRIATFSSAVKCLLGFLMRSLRYLNGRTLSPFPTEAGHAHFLHAL